MKTERWRQISQLYDEALALSGRERTEFLRHACAGDAALQREVESLLAQEGGAASFLKHPPQLESGDSSRDLIGQQIGPHKIMSLLGAGGMGEVYRARDTTLGRDVAIKVLPARFTADRARLARFEREARMLATLNHPHIGGIYGFENEGAGCALVLELVEGPTLADRLTKGPLPPTEALTLARQITEALEAAHEKGLIHRDLKPSNIKITPDGSVKVLDFGLAKAVAGDVGVDRSQSPTLTTDGTREGMIVGTAAYMSPEQARGHPVDKRTDIWAFGCVLYEMLTGRVPFAGDSISDTIAATLNSEPDWTALPHTTSAPIRTLVRRCLEKDRRRRLADMCDARLEIDDAFSVPLAVAAAPASTSRTRERVMWASALMLVGLMGAAAVGWATRSVSVSPETTRTLVSVEPGAGGARPSRTAVALSPDGKTLVFGAIWGGDQQLYARAMGQLSATPMPGTSGGISPFFSPDGQWVGFVAGGELRKVPLRGGPAVTLCKAATLFGASWGSDGTIVFAGARNGGLWRVPAAGGTPEAITTLQPGEYSHRLPHILPGGRAVIFTISKGANQWDDTQVVVRSLETGRQTLLIEGGADGRYVPTGHLVYVRLGTLMAAPFDPVRRVLTGGATGLIDGVMQAANLDLSQMQNTLAAQFTVSDTGALIYVTGGVVPPTQRSLGWVDRQGASQALPAPPRAYRAPRLSPDGQRVAVHILDGIREVWRYDIARGALSAVTVDGRSSHGIFAPDQKRIAFRSGAAGGEDNLYWKAADGSGSAERLTTSARVQTPASWSPDGTTLAFVEEGDSPSQSQIFQFDIWVLSIGDRKARALIRTAASETSPEFSPDGRWLAYVSNQSGQGEVYVQPYPGPGERHLISTNGGGQPAWGRNGRELFYVQPAESSSRPMKLMSVSIGTIPTFVAGTPEALFESLDLASTFGRNYDVAPDGRQFLMTLNKGLPANPPPVQMIFVQNWFEELKRLVPTK